MCCHLSGWILSRTCSPQPFRGGRAIAHNGLATKRGGKMSRGGSQMAKTARWKLRFRAPIILSTQLAKSAPTRGLAVSNRSGVHHLYTWDVHTGSLRQLTDRPGGVIFGVISPDGSYVYYLNDQQGNEIGHYVRVPFEGGLPQDLTPEMPPYSPSFDLQVSRVGNLVGFTVASDEGYSLYCIQLT